MENETEIGSVSHLLFLLLAEELPQVAQGIGVLESLVMHPTEFQEIISSVH